MDGKHIKELVNKYKESIEGCKKNIYEVINFLKQEVNVISFDLVENEDSRRFYKKHIEDVKIYTINSTRNYNINFDCTNLWDNYEEFARRTKNIGKRFDHEDLEIILFEVVKDSKSEKYYKKHEKDIVIPKRNIIIPMRIVVIFEIKTEYIFSNNDFLYKELYLYRGIDEFDIENMTPLFINYLTFIDMWSFRELEE